MLIREKRARLAFNIVALNTVWLITVLGAARGHDLIGILAALAHLALHCALVSDRPRMDLAMCGMSLALGFITDSLLIAGGAMAFPLDPLAIGVWPLWMAALWINFSATLRLTLAWLVPHPFLFALVGGIAGPVAYFAGAELNALEVSLATPHLLMFLGTWSVSSWALAMIARRTLGSETERTA